MIRRFSSLLFAVLAGLSAAIAGAWTLSIPVSDWKIAGPFGGTATTVAIDPQSPKTVLAGAMNSLLFQSQDFGESWLALDFPKRNLGEVTSVLVDPVNSDHYLVGVLDAFGGGLYESRDQGKSWNAVADLRDTGVRAIVAAPSNPSEFVAGTLRGVMLSSDSGKSWQRISDPNNFEMRGITAIAIDPQNPAIIYAGTAHLPWRTTDSGKTWESIHSGMIDDSDVFSIYINPLAPTSVYASACSGIYQSENRGDVWRKLAGIPNTSRRTHVVREDPVHAGTVYAGTTMGLFKSANAGVSWKVVTDTQVNGLAFDPSQPGSIYLAMAYEGVGKSHDSAENIKLSNNGFVDRQISAVTSSVNRLVAIETQEGETTGIFTSADRGETWSPMHVTRGLAGVHLRSIAGASSEERIFLGAGHRQMYKSIDGGGTWKPVPLRVVVPPPPEPAKTAPPVKTAPRSKQVARARARRPIKPKIVIREVSPSEISGLYSVKSGTKDLFFAATDLGLFKSTDMGEQWTACDLGGAPPTFALYVSPAGDGRFIAKTNFGLFVSKDFGDHWEKMLFPLLPSDINDVAIPGNQAAPLLVATRVGLYSSPDGGSTWYTSTNGIQASTVSSVVYNTSGDTAYAVEYGQLYETKNGGSSWSQVPTALHSLPIRQLWIPNNAANRLYAITSGLGILFRD
jgi:photosystem II stability/assembly factor-like uncharacterized protein